MSLLAQARKHNPRRITKKHPPTELEELAIAWLHGIISYAQVCKALNTTGSSAYGKLGVALRRAITSGRIQVKQKL